MDAPEVSSLMQTPLRGGKVHMAVSSISIMNICVFKFPMNFISFVSAKFNVCV